MQYIKHIIIPALFLANHFTIAQEVLTLEKSIQQAMENNYNIKIAKNTTVIAQEQATLGNAGLLPTLSANGSATYGINNTTLEVLGAPEQTEINGAKSLSYNAGLQFSYVLFNGLGTFHSYKKLKTNSTAVEIQERMNIESILLQTTQGYYQVLQAQNTLDISKDALQISKERKERVKLNFKMAGGSRLDWLNAQVDYNTDSATFVNAQNNYKSSQLRLNQLIGKANDTAYKVDNILKVNELINLKDLQLQAKENNTTLLNAMYTTQLSEFDVKINKAAMQPNLSFQSGYNYSRAENEASILAFQQNIGWSSSLVLSIPLYDGKKKNIQLQTAKIVLENAAYSKLETETTLERDLQIAFSNYKNSLKIANLDKQSIETAQLNFDRTKEFLVFGQVTNTQFREAQLNLLRVKNQTLNNQIAIKLYEVELMRLSGQLIQ